MRAGSDNSRMFGFRADHKARNVLNKEQRRRVTIAVFDKIRRFFSRFGVNDAAEFRRFAGFAFHHSAMIGDDADVPASNPRRPANHFLRVVGLKLVELAFV